MEKAACLSINMRRIGEYIVILIEKLIALIKYFQEKEFIRFLEVGFVNTAIGYVVIILYREIGIEIMWSQALSFITCFPIAYTTQALFTFRTKWSLRRMFVYPLSILPNYLIQAATLAICSKALHIPDSIAALIGQAAPLPVMFFINRFLVKGRKQKTENEINIK